MSQLVLLRLIANRMSISSSLSYLPFPLFLSGLRLEGQPDDLIEVEAIVCIGYFSDNPSSLSHCRKPRGKN